MTKPISIAILTISDRCSAGRALDTSGPALIALAATHLNATLHAAACVADDRHLISDQLVRWATAPCAPDLLLTTGGTGLSPRDITPEATLTVLERRHTALIDLMRLRCLPHTPKTFLSRGEAGTIATTLVINLPGSHRGATEGFLAIVDVLPHAIAMLRGEDGGHTEQHRTCT